MMIVGCFKQGLCLGWGGGGGGVLPYMGYTYIRILFYLVCYTSYIDIVPNKFTI